MRNIANEGRKYKARSFADATCIRRRIVSKICSFSCGVLNSTSPCDISLWTLKRNWGSKSLAEARKQGLQEFQCMKIVEKSSCNKKNFEKRKEWTAGTCYSLWEGMWYQNYGHLKSLLSASFRGSTFCVWEVRWWLWGFSDEAFRCFGAEIARNIWGRFPGTCRVSQNSTNNARNLTWPRHAGIVG